MVSFFYFKFDHQHVAYIVISSDEQTKNFVSTKKKGVFKNSGTVLTESQVEEELDGLNPLMTKKKLVIPKPLLKKVTYIQLTIRRMLRIKVRQMMTR
jgi:uncharacterized protein YhbP (UPF0306 family)